MNLRRRANLLYSLRKKGIKCDTKRKIIFMPYLTDTLKYGQVGKLCREFHFVVQWTLVATATNNI